MKRSKTQSVVIEVQFDSELNQTQALTIIKESLEGYRIHDVIDGKISKVKSVTNFLKQKKKKENTPICKECNRNIKSPLFDGCMNEDTCPHGFKPCL